MIMSDIFYSLWKCLEKICIIHHRGWFPQPSLLCLYSKHTPPPGPPPLFSVCPQQTNTEEWCVGCVCIEYGCWQSRELVVGKIGNVPAVCGIM